MIIQLGLMQCDEPARFIELIPTTVQYLLLHGWRVGDMFAQAPRGYSSFKEREAANGFFMRKEYGKLNLQSLDAFARLCNDPKVWLPAQEVVVGKKRANDDDELRPRTHNRKQALRDFKEHLEHLTGTSPNPVVAE